MGTMLENKYKRLYDAITQRGFERIPVSGEYYELHHIQPKALGGSDEPENLCYLTPKEHYICHHLLAKCTEGEEKRKMYFAWHLMCFCDKTEMRYIPAVQYDHLRRELAKLGKSEEHKRKISESSKKRKPRKFSEQAKRNMSEARKKNWANGQYAKVHYKGIPKSEEQKAKMAEARRKWWAKKKEQELLSIEK